MEEGQNFEAGVVAGIEDADASQEEVRTKQVLEDDVPLEYLKTDLDRLNRKSPPVTPNTAAKQTAPSPRGALALTGAYSLRQSVNGPFVKGEWLLGVTGLLSLVFGVVVAMQSGTDVAPFMWTLGTYALLSGALLVALALNIRTWPRTT